MISCTSPKWNFDKGMTKNVDRSDCRDCHLGETGDPSDYFHSVEFSVNGLNVLYQSKIWNASSASMFALVKENSDILSWIHVGDVLNMKYYTRDTMCPTRNFDTKIEYITKDHEGRFKGHYLVGLEILVDQHPAVQAAQLS